MTIPRGIVHRPHALGRTVVLMGEGPEAGVGFQAAAARWHARSVIEAGLPLREAEAVMTLLCRMRGHRV